MILFAGVGILVLAGFLALFMIARRPDDVPAFILAALPLALLFIIVPVPVMAIQTVRAFQAVAAEGHGGAKVARDVVLHIARPLWLGGAGFLVTMAVAAAAPALAARRATLADPDPPACGARPTWGNWILVPLPLVIVPVAALYRALMQVATITASAAVTLAPGARPPAGLDPSEMSRTIAARLVVAALGGGLVALVVAALAVGALVASRFTDSHRFAKYSWGVFAVVAVLAVWNLVDVGASIRAFDQLAP